MNLQVEPPEKKRSRKKKPTTHSSRPPSSSSFSLLPDEIAVNCLAQISRAYYPGFSIISKSFRSLLSSTELYTVRSLIGSTEQCLYVCLSNKSCQSPQWFTLWINPNRTLTVPTIKKKKKKTVQKWLAPIPSSDFSSVSKSTLLIGSEIYVIGGLIKTGPSCRSSSLRILDCRTNTWRDAPSMTVARRHALTCFYDGKIYVMGGCGELEEPWAEVFDTNTQTWEPLSDPGTEIRNIGSCKFYTIKEIKGKIYFWDSEVYAYDTSQRNWKSFGSLGDLENFFRFQQSTCLTDGIPKLACVIDGVQYDYIQKSINISHGLYYRKRTKDGGDWKVVKGLESLRAMYNRNGGSNRNNTSLVSCGGKLLLLWEGFMKHNPSNRKKIWCTEITLETDDEGEIWGNAEWIDVVQHVPIQSKLLYSLVVSV